MIQAELKKYCTKIYRIIDKGIIDGEEVSGEIVSDYYKKSSFFYRKFHSDEGAMHLPVAMSNGATHKQKLRYQADVVHNIVQENNYSDILELGCGMGFNTRYLAGKNPDKKFTGIDLTGDNVRRAKLAAENMDNAAFVQGDFDDLDNSELGDKKFDLIFGVETLCHSKDLVQLLSGLKNRLNENGRIVIFDGYIKPGKSSLKNEHEINAYQLLSWGFAMKKFQMLDEVLKSERLNYLNVEEVSEYTENILPNYLAFQKGARLVLKFPFLLKLFLKIGIIPMELIKQLSAGMFGPYFLHSGYLGYYKLVMAKR